MDDEGETTPGTRPGRSSWQVAAGVVAVLAVIGGAAAVSVLARDEDKDSGETTVPAFGAPPEGTRWAGRDGVVVAVPDWWTTGDTRCYAPVEDTVYYDPSATVDCADPDYDQSVDEVSALAMLNGAQGYGELVTRDMEHVGTVDGHQVVESPQCEEWFEDVCRRLFAVPSRGVVFAVTIDEPGDGDYVEIRDSLRILPDGMTTVPIATDQGWTPSWGSDPDAADALMDAIRKAGLVVDVVTPEPSKDVDTVLYADLPPGSFLGAEPDLGSVIEEGGTVTVTVMGREHRK